MNKVRGIEGWRYFIVISFTILIKNQSANGAEAHATIQRITCMPIWYQYVKTYELKKIMSIKAPLMSVTLNYTTFG